MKPSLPRRRDFLTSIIVQVGISLSKYRGWKSGVQFLIYWRVEEAIVSRVIFEPAKRRMHRILLMKWADDV